MRNKGFTLTELMIVVVIMGILAAVALPSISDYLDKRKIINAAEAVYGQLQFARSQAIARSATVYASFGYTDATNEKTWLMGVSTNNGCDITQTVTAGDVSDDCTLVVSDGLLGLDTGDGSVDPNDLVYYVLSGVNFNDVELDSDGVFATSSGAPGQISFDPTRGTALNRTVFLNYEDQLEMRVVVGIIGRIRICTPNNIKRVPGYKTC